MEIFISQWGQQIRDNVVRIDDLFWRPAKNTTGNRRPRRQIHLARSRNVPPWVHKSGIRDSFITFIEDPIVESRNIQDMGPGLVELLNVSSIDINQIALEKIFTVKNFNCKDQEMNLRAEIRIDWSKTQLSFVNSASFSDLPNSRCTMKRAKHWGDLQSGQEVGPFSQKFNTNGKASYYSNCICLHRTHVGEWDVWNQLILGDLALAFG